MILGRPSCSGATPPRRSPPPASWSGRSSASRLCLWWWTRTGSKRTRPPPRCRRCSKATAPAGAWPTAPSWWRSSGGRWKLYDSASLDRKSISFFTGDKHQESAASRWVRAGKRIAKVGKGLCKDEKAQQLALRHWLEAIDPRHRYGHNLHLYYDIWFNSSSSSEPFFYWYGNLLYSTLASSSVMDE
jgi:hypothetical protein